MVIAWASGCFGVIGTLRGVGGGLPPTPLRVLMMEALYRPALSGSCMRVYLCRQYRGADSLLVLRTLSSKQLRSRCPAVINVQALEQTPGLEDIIQVLHKRPGMLG